MARTRRSTKRSSHHTNDLVPPKAKSNLRSSNVKNEQQEIAGSGAKAEAKKSKSEELVNRVHWKKMVSSIDGLGALISVEPSPTETDPITLRKVVEAGTEEMTRFQDKSKTVKIVDRASWKEVVASIDILGALASVERLPKKTGPISLQKIVVTATEEMMRLQGKTKTEKTIDRTSWKKMVASIDRLGSLTSVGRPPTKTGPTSLRKVVIAAVEQVTRLQELAKMPEAPGAIPPQLLKRLEAIAGKAEKERGSARNEIFQKINAVPAEVLKGLRVMGTTVDKCAVSLDSLKKIEDRATNNAIDHDLIRSMIQTVQDCVTALNRLVSEAWSARAASFDSANEMIDMSLHLSIVRENEGRIRTLKKS